jgi:apolipoprotein N-acyltransferase
MTTDAPQRRRRWRSLALAFGSVSGGVVAAGAFPPFDASVLMVVGLAVGIGVARRIRTGGRAAAAGFGWGIGYFAVVLAWSGRFGLGAWLTLATSQAAFLVPMGWVAWRTRNGSFGAAIVATTAAATVAAAVRARLPLGGLEWAQLGVAAHGLPLRPSAALVGALGVTALLIAVAAAVAITTEAPRRAATWRPLLATVVLAGTCTVIGAAPWTRAAGLLDVAVVQTGAPCPGRAAVDCPNERELLLDDLSASTARLDGPLDLVVWGEGVLSAATPMAAGADLLDTLGTLPTPLLAGVTSPAPDNTFFNRNVLFDTGGSVLGSYTKRQSVPFGEYVPGRRFLGGVREVGRLVPRDMRRGGPPGRLPLGEVTLGTVSSWEASFSRLVRDVATGSQAIVVLTTQATYGEAAVSDQLLRAAQLRAAELQRSVVVAATTGRSVVVGPHGTRGPTTRLYGPDTLAATVELRTGATPFSRSGDVPVLTTAVGGLWFVRPPRPPLGRRT